MIINCRHYRGHRPCKFHKIDRRLCEDCINYEPIDFQILIVKLDALGDVLRTTSILPALKHKYPNSTITWVTRRNAFELLDNNPQIDRLLEFEGNYLPYILNEMFDLGVCLDADLQSATILSLAKCEKKFGFVCDNFGRLIPANEEAHDWYFMGVNDTLKRRNRISYHEHINKMCQLQETIVKPQLALSDAAKEFAKYFSEKNALSKFNKIIGINTGGGKRWQMKKWINSSYVELIRLINKNYPEIGILLIGGPEENDFNRMIKDEVSELIIDAGCHNSIKNFSALIDLTHIFLTPDSLGMHISIALEKVTIVLVGPTSPWELHVFGKGEIIYNKHLDCIACYNPTCEKKINCMNTISPLWVLKSIAKYI